MCQALETKTIIKIVASVFLLTVISGGIGAGITIYLKREVETEDQNLKVKVIIEQLKYIKIKFKKTGNEGQGSNLITGNKIKLPEKRITGKKKAQNLNKVRNILFLCKVTYA